MPGQMEIAVMPATTMDTMTDTGTMKGNRMCDRELPPTAGMLSDGPPATPGHPDSSIRILDPSGGESITALRPGGIGIFIAVRMPNRRNGTTAIIIRPIRSGQSGRVIFSPLPYSSPVWR
jgi:hypothetical protein